MKKNMSKTIYNDELDLFEIFDILFGAKIYNILNCYSFKSLKLVAFFFLQKFKPARQDQF